jgi:anti-sigma factor RsiW
MASERGDPPVSRILTDRIRADPELVEQVLNPDRTDENVRYPDPTFPRDSDREATGPDSLADMKMARRTDAGLRQGLGSLGGSSPTALLWIAAAVLAVVVLLVALAT